MAARFFSITELVEQMLLELPMKDLLCAQSINKHFKVVIEGSIRCQQALFFSPASDDGRVQTIINPLLWRSRHSYYRARLNPNSYILRGDPQELDNEASALRMLLVQPPRSASVHSMDLLETHTGPNTHEFDPMDYRDGARASSWTCAMLDYQGEEFGAYYVRARILTGRISDVYRRGLVCTDDGNGEVTILIGDWEQVWWTTRARTKRVSS